jgi:hypothetical protein
MRSQMTRRSFRFSQCGTGNAPAFVFAAHAIFTAQADVRQGIPQPSIHAPSLLASRAAGVNVVYHRLHLPVALLGNAFPAVALCS